MMKSVLVSTQLVLVVAAAIILGFATSPAAATAGTATYYTVYRPSSCYGYEDKGVMIAAASAALWNNRQACGKKFRVRCTGGTNSVPHPCKPGSVTVTIVDYCPPPGCRSTLDLSKEAFSIIANPDAGKVRIDYEPA